MSTPKRSQRMMSMAAATALGLVAIAGSATAAMAAPQDFGDIDTSRTGSLTLHKFLVQSGTATGDISAPPADGDFSDPVADVEFTVYPLLQGGDLVDLGVPANWDGIADITPGAGCTAPAGFTLGTPTVMPLTGADGSATTALPVGLYQVCETAAPANIIEKAIPFILTIPMPHLDGWVYDVHAYPKNSKGSIEKSVEIQDDLGLGSIVSFPVSVPVPRTNQEWTGFAIRDNLDPRLSAVDPADVTALIDGAAIDPSYYTITNDGQVVTFNLTAAGLAWLNAGPNDLAGSTITVTFAGVVTEIGNGSISNTAELWTNNPGFDPEGNPPMPSNEVNSHWGNIDILKRAAGTTGATGTLSGAEFEIYDAADPYASDCSTAVATGDPIAVDGETTFTSSATGTISIAGLFVSDSVNPVIDAGQRCYVLKETAAPSGYVLPSDPFTAVTVLMGDTVEDNVEIENTQQEVPELPLTGGAGQMLLIAGGLAAIAAAITLMVVRARKARI